MKLIGELVFTGVRKKEGHEPGGGRGGHNQREGRKEGGDRTKMGVDREADKKTQMVHHPRERKGF